METVKQFTTLMLTRRGYTDIDFIDADEEGNPGKKPRFIARNPLLKHKLIVFFIHKQNKTEKVTINVVKSIISIAKEITHIMIVHDTVLTSDAKQNITNSSDSVISLYQFETFTFDDMSYDLFSVLFEDPNDKSNINIVKKHANSNKFPILLSTDPLARYLRFRQGDVVEGRFGDTNITLRRCINVL